MSKHKGAYVLLLRIHDLKTGFKKIKECAATVIIPLNYCFSAIYKTVWRGLLQIDSRWFSFIVNLHIKSLLQIWGSVVYLLSNTVHIGLELNRWESCT